MVFALGSLQNPGNRMCGFQNWFGQVGKAQSLLTLLGFESWLLGHPAINLVSILTMTYWLPLITGKWFRMFGTIPWDILFWIMDLSKSLYMIHWRSAFLSFSVVARWTCRGVPLLSCFLLFSLLQKRKTGKTGPRSFVGYQKYEATIFIDNWHKIVVRLSALSTDHL